MQSIDVWWHVSHYLDPQTFRNFRCLNKTFYNIPSITDIANIMLSKGWDFNKCMSKAAEIGNLKLVQFFIDKGANHWNWGMYGAAEGGHQHIVDYLNTLKTKI